MEMTIEAAINVLNAHKPYDVQNAYEVGEAISIAIDTMRKYQQLQADYENRLKADLVAMLTDIYMEIEELDTPSDFDSYDAGIVDCEGLIQQKINSLKEVKDGENNN